MMRFRFIAVAAALLAVDLLAMSGCGLVYDVDSLGAGGAAPGDADVDVALDAADAATAAACPSRRGPKMVEVGGYCIDTTEVTVADYVPFAAAVGVLPAAEPCRWVTSLEPDDLAAQQKNPARPIVNVNFCHASLYCTWAGKRLCGSVGGGRVALGEAGADPHTNQWLRACTHDGRQPYPYGKTVAVDACPGNKVGPVATRKACSGPYEGLFDMVGNVGEWVDGCEEGNPAGAQHDACIVLGEENTQGEASCYDRTEVSRYQVSPYLGFRCCGP